MVQTNLIRGKMAEHGYTIKDMAAATNCHEVTFSRKLKAGSFSIQEVQLMAKKLDLGEDDINRIFFTRQDT